MSSKPRLLGRMRSGEMAQEALLLADAGARRCALRRRIQATTTPAVRRRPGRRRADAAAFSALVASSARQAELSSAC